MEYKNKNLFHKQYSSYLNFCFDKKQRMLNLIILNTTQFLRLKIN